MIDPGITTLDRAANFSHALDAMTALPQPGQPYKASGSGAYHRNPGVLPPPYVPTRVNAPASHDLFRAAPPPGGFTPSAPAARQHAMPPCRPTPSPVGLPLTLNTLDAAHKGDLIALAKIKARDRRYAPLCRQLPHVTSKQAFRKNVAAACNSLDYRNPDKPPQILLGDQHGATATIDAVNEAATAMWQNGMRGKMLVEFSKDQVDLLRKLEGVARPLMASLGGYKPGLVEALTEKLLPLARQRCQDNGQAFSEAAMRIGTRQWATLSIAMMRAKDAGFDAVPIDLKNTEPAVRREQYMRDQYRRYSKEPLIILTGGLHLNALLPALEHDNFTAVTYSSTMDGKAEVARRSLHQGVLNTWRYHLYSVSDEVAHADPFR